MVEGNKVKVRCFESEILDLELDANVQLKVTEAPDAVIGNTTNNPQKFIEEIGRGSGREREVWYVWSSEVEVSLE